MIHKIKHWLLISIFLVVSIHTFSNDKIDRDTMSVHAMRILKKLNATLLNYIENDEKSHNHGAINCPYCKLYHTRASEAVFPFAFEYQQTGNKKYLKAAISTGNWLIRQQQVDGSWLETPEEWTGTTTDQALMLSMAYPILKPHLSELEIEQWKNSIEKAGDYLEKVMSPAFASINYCATTTATLMYVNTIIKKASYVNKAKELAYQVVAKMDHDYFLTGEGGRVFGVKYGVDLGYNMEMSLWGLALYAQLAGDKYIMESVSKSLENHLPFIYPDGSMDASWGIRSNKWTCFGSGTSDGCQTLFSLFMDRDDRYRTASIRNMQYLEKCTQDGIVGFGPLYFDIFDYLPCIYPTFTKAKNMAMAIKFAKADAGKTPLIPSDIKGLRYFPTLNVSLVRTDEWCATISAYTYKDPSGDRSKYMHRPTGGSVTNLWLKDHGYFQASSQTVYKRWEPMSFPEMGEIRPLTPRIEFDSEQGNFTNLYEFDALMTYKENKGVYTVTSIGELKNSKQQEGGISYRLSHEVKDNSIAKEVELVYHDVKAPVRIIEPIIDYPDMIFTQVDNKTVRISAGKKTVELIIYSDNVELELGTDRELYRFPYPALRAYPIILNVKNTGELRQTVKFEYRIKTGE